MLGRVQFYQVQNRVVEKELLLNIKCDTLQSDSCWYDITSEFF